MLGKINLEVNMEQIPAFEHEKKEKVKKSGYIIAIIILSVLLVVSNLFIFLGVYSRFNLLNFEPAFALGDTITINLEENSSSSSGLSFAGSYLQGVKYLGKTSVKMSNSINPVVLRSKFYTMIDNGGILNVTPIIDSNWIVGEDGYYYYIFKLNKGEKITLSNGYILPSFNANQDKLYVVNIACETLTDNLDYATIWATAPSEWLDVLSKMS